MATTTTNFGWDIPQSTDLVKDGATAIAALGQDIDTALVDLKGGTTGQVLAKASATDLDYSWTTPQVGDITAVTAGTGISGGGTGGDVTITNSMATAIDAKGDLIAGTGADAFARLAIGAVNNTVLTVDSTTATGLKYSADYTSYTPVWSVNSGTAPSLGNGTLNGRYLLVGKLCHVQIFFQGGSTTTYGSGGIWQFTLPFSSNELSGNTGGFSGSAYVEDAGIAGYQALAVRKGGGANSCQLAMSSTQMITSAVPFTWGTSDFFNMSLVYGVA
jgi:hypothetical protein